MTKQEILEYFKDINHAYNESTRLDDLSRMIDELTQPNENLATLQKSLEDLKANPIPYDGIMIILLTSISTSIAQIADVMNKDIKEIYIKGDPEKWEEIKKILNRPGS